MADPREPTRPLSLIDEASSIRAPRLKLAVIAGPDVGAELLLDRQPALVGGDPAAALRLTDSTVSRRHLHAAIIDDGVWLRDLGSRNGSSYLGGRFAEIVVGVGAVVRIGRTELRVVPEGVKDALPPSSNDHFGELRGSSLPMRQLFAVLERVAATDVPVLVEGETGTGKELAAEALHAASRRASGAFVVCDLGGVSRGLVEPELFGHAAGTSGYEGERDGAFIQASGGTIFIDEVGETDLELQPRLLRAIERRQVKRVGEANWRSVDVRVIAATNRDLAEEVRAGRFREDLFHRLAVVRVRLPPLRERKEDIPMLVNHLLARAVEAPMHNLPRGNAPSEAGRGDTTRDLLQPAAIVPPETMVLLMHHDWPGNVRELKNVLDRGLSLVNPREGERTGRPVLTPELLGLGVESTPQSAPSSTNFHEAKEQLVTAWERDFVHTLLRRAGGNVSRAAREAGMDRVYLHRLIKKHGIVTSNLDEG